MRNVDLREEPPCHARSLVFFLSLVVTCSVLCVAFGAFGGRGDRLQANDPVVNGSLGVAVGIERLGESVRARRECVGNRVSHHICYFCLNK